MTEESRQIFSGNRQGIILQSRDNDGSDNDDEIYNENSSSCLRVLPIIATK